jgi:riboflavin kinase/FMN adenylyltransferase
MAAEKGLLLLVLISRTEKGAEPVKSPCGRIPVIYEDASMKHLHGIDQLTLGDCCLTVGVFDGVHRGHQGVMRRLVDEAHELDVPPVVITFWPHPATVLSGARVRCLTSDDERAELLGSLGVEVVITQQFDAALAATSYQDFVNRLKRRLGFSRIVVGYDFALGRDREGNAFRLAGLGRKLGYSVDVVPALGDESGVISSTEIRKLVATGDVAEAAKLLGHAYGLDGFVVHGDSRGRQLGFPTANIDYPADKILPLNGVYACWAWVDSVRFAAAVNVGVRPQFHDGSTAPLVEAYLLDFDRQIYASRMRLEFVRRLRDESKFATVPELIAQIHRDVDQVRQLLTGS